MRIRLFPRVLAGNGRVLLALVAAALIVAFGAGQACKRNLALTFDAAELESIVKFLDQHAEAMRVDGVKMIEAGRANNSAHVIADGEHQIADSLGLMKVRDQINAMVGELARNPLTGTLLNVERAIANGRTLQAEGDALKAHGDAMVAHGNLMRDLAHEPGQDWMLEGAEAMLRDSLQLGQIAKRMQDVGAAMVQFGLDVRRSVGR